ncbi:MAG: transglutaminase domain-containing protein [Deltaproteobacteria bacterium]|nr:transglutaminase domain-containing protein [Deltaproteobacteria bacterium]
MNITDSSKTLFITFTRTLFLAVFLFVANEISPLGTSPLLLIGLGALGVVAATRLSELKLRFAAFTSLIAISLAALYLAKLIAIEIAVSFTSNALFIHSIFQHLTLAVLVFYVGFVSTWLFWRYHHTLTIEILFLSSIGIILLSGHREYHLDSPQIINSLAWHLGFEPQTMFITCGAFIFLILLLYAYFSSSHRTRNLGRTQENVARQKQHTLTTLLAFAAIVFFTVITGKAVYNSYNIQKGLTTNGVGEAEGSGTSPLGFHSALGSTNQPAALVRLEEDYSQNPFTPMLYMREAALSEFNGHELVVAPSNYDADVANINPGQTYSTAENVNLKNRVSVTHSVYLLADQKKAFAIDYPVTIRQLKNPDPKRFKNSYRAYSLAPTYKLNQLRFSSVGNPKWTNEVLQHYTRQNPDSRYRDLALDLSKDAAAPVEKIMTIVNFLNKNAIYTLTPNHEVDPDKDPVEPFLFGDMRGYCVHFAHATVYMLRALGIPARIATGYLTDLSQARDGHILLRMSDRHAWAEAYLEGEGWVPFDTQPEQVESHADTQVDSGLLEELMSSLDPGEEILPKENLEEENETYDVGELYVPSYNDILIIVLFALLLLVAIKAYIRYSWVFTRSPQTRALHSYRAVLYRLIDLGFGRTSAETRAEHRTRISSSLASDPLELQRIVEKLKYQNPTKIKLKNTEIDQLRSDSLNLLSELSFSKRFIAFCNPTSLFAHIRRQR